MRYLSPNKSFTDNRIGDSLQHDDLAHDFCPLARCVDEGTVVGQPAVGLARGPVLVGCRDAGIGPNPDSFSHPVAHS